MPKTPDTTLPPQTTFAGHFSEVAAWVRELVKQGLMTRDEAIKKTEEAYRDTMLNQLQGFPVEGLPEDLPDHTKKFSGTTDSEGNIIFSNSTKK
jgi:hypothetical protein